MQRTKYLHGPCSECGGSIEYPAQMVGTSTQCPHCGKVTLLLLHTPPPEPALPRRVIVWTLIAILVLVLGFAGTIAALKRAERIARERNQPAPTTLSPAPPGPVKAPPQGS